MRNKIEITCKVNGKSVPLSSISDKTLTAIKENEKEDWLCKKVCLEEPRIILNIKKLSDITKDKLINAIKKGEWVSIKCNGQYTTSNCECDYPISAYYADNDLEVIC